jgi:glycosyltransferase involved in cell wall biosynthesis
MMTTEPIPVTVAVPVRNEERGLDACLERLGRFARVVVLDSGSTDRTCEIARAHHADVLQFKWNGCFPKKRNWFLRNHPPTTPWVLFLDADEWVDHVFCEEVAATLPGTTHDGFWLTYDNWFLGRRLRHGTPNRKLALFRVGSGEYERIDEQRWSKFDMEIHEHPVLRGSVGSIHARIDHRDDRGLEHWKRRHSEYALWEARRALTLRAQETGPKTGRQGLKYRFLGAWWLPVAYFLDSYVRRLGFLDGWPGLRHAWLKSRYFAEVGRLMRSFSNASGETSR